MIRKYGIGLMAFIIAISLAAFTSPEKTLVTGTNVFEFKSGLDYTTANVSNIANWEYLGDISAYPLCSGSQKACRIVVGDAYIDNTSNPPELTGVTISSSLSGVGKAIVDGISNSSENGYSNQP